MHISMSFSHELKTDMTLAEYLPLHFCIFGSHIFLNSSAMSWRLCDAMEASALVPFPFCCGVLGLTSASLSVSLPDISLLGILDTLKDTGWGTKWGIDEIDHGLTTRLLNVTLCPWQLLAMAMCGTWGWWNTSSRLRSLPLLILFLLDDYHAAYSQCLGWH